MIYTTRRRRDGDAHVGISTRAIFLHIPSRRDATRAKCNLAKTPGSSVFAASPLEIELAGGRVNFFFQSQSRDRNTRREFRAAIFVGAASENQLNGNNESPMHVERSTYVLQSCDAIVCPWRSGTYFQICTHKTDELLARIFIGDIEAELFSRAPRNRSINSTAAAHELFRWNPINIERERDWKRTVLVLMRFDDSNIYPERIDIVDPDCLVKSRNNKLTFYQSPCNISRIAFWIFIKV